MTYKQQVDAARYIAAVFHALTEQVPPPPKPAELEWGAVASVAGAHSLSSLVFLTLERPLAEELPPEIYERWKRRTDVARAKHLSQSVEFSHLAELFEKRSVHFLPLKGFALKELYPSPELREMSDIDIYVDPQSFDGAVAALREAGYEEAEDQEVHAVFKKPPFIDLELHRVLYAGAPVLPLAPLKCREGRPFWHVMNEIDEFLFLLRHAEKHDGAGGCGMKSVFDIYLYMKKHGAAISAPALAESLRESGLADIYEKLSALAAFWFAGAPATAPVLDFELYTVTGGAYGTLDNEVRKHAAKGRARYVLARLFPPYSFMCKAFPVLKKCPPLLPFMYAGRIIRSLFDGGAYKTARAVGKSGEAQRKIDEYKAGEQNDN